MQGGSVRGGVFCGFPPCYQVLAAAPAADKQRMCHTPADISFHPNRAYAASCGAFLSVCSSFDPDGER